MVSTHWLVHLSPVAVGFKVDLYARIGSTRVPSSQLFSLEFAVSGSSRLLYASRISASQVLPTWPSPLSFILDLSPVTVFFRAFSLERGQCVVLDTFS